MIGDISEGHGHFLPPQLEIIYQVVDNPVAVDFYGFGQAGVERSGFRAHIAEDVLNGTKIQPLF